MSPGDKIKFFRLLSCLTQDDLALIADTNQRYIANIELNKYKPSPSVLEWIAWALQLHQDFILTDIFTEEENDWPVLDSNLSFYSLEPAALSSKLRSDTNDLLRNALPEFLREVHARNCFFIKELKSFIFPIPFSRISLEEVSIPEFTGHKVPLDIIIIYSYAPIFERTIRSTVRQLRIFEDVLTYDKPLPDIENIETEALKTYVSFLYEKLKGMGRKKWEVHLPYKLSRKRTEDRFKLIKERVAGKLAEDTARILERYKISVSEFSAALSEKYKKSPV